MSISMAPISQQWSYTFKFLMENYFQPRLYASQVINQKWEQNKVILICKFSQTCISSYPLSESLHWRNIQKPSDIYEKENEMLRFVIII